MSDLQDRLERLAQRGTPRGGDAVLEAAKTSVEHDAVAAIGMDPSRRQSPRRHFSSLVAAAGVAATLFVGMLAFSAFLGAGGGSDSPEGAVRQLADAVSHEDALAAADVLAPEEVQSLSRTIDQTARRAQELQLARTASAPLAGLDLSVDNLDLSTETMADGYVKVTVSSGTLSSQTQNEKFAPVMQRVLRNTTGPKGQVDLARLAKSLNLPTFVMTVKRGGQWYVSAAYTTLEYIREANQLPPADFGSGVRATATLGADTPDAAVTEAMQALQRSDWKTLISLAPPDEIPVYDYRDALMQLGADNQTHFTIDKLETTSTVSGDTAKVTLHTAGTTDSGRWALDGGCFKPPLQDRLVSTSAWCALTPYYTVLPFYGSSPASVASAQVTVVRKDGRWFVSPVGTALDLIDRYVRDFTQRQLYTMLNVPELLPVDATLTLGRPVTQDDRRGGAYVYALDAHRGDRFLGLVTWDPPAGDSYGGAAVLVYSPDGEVMRDSYDLIDGRGLEIPTDGTYRIVVRPYFQRITFTVWPEAQAPEAAKHPPTEGMYDGCHPTGNGGETCSSSASVGTSSSSSSSSSSSTSSSDAGTTGTCVTGSDGLTTCRDVTSSSSRSSSSSSSGSGGVTATTATSVPGG